MDIAHNLPPSDIFDPFALRLLSFPSKCACQPLPLQHLTDRPAVPTIAAINGHAFAAGMILSLLCDYRVMTDGAKRNAWMCMNEVRTVPQSTTTMRVASLV